jgi:type III secretion protein K
VARYAGAILCAPRLRRAIAGSEVRQLTSVLGADVLDFARNSAENIHPGIGNLNPSEEEVMTGAVDRLGRATVMAAMQGAGPELALRAELKLPAESIAESPCDTSTALALGLSLLRITDPTWHSSFPAMR